MVVLKIKPFTTTSSVGTMQCPNWVRMAEDVGRYYTAASDEDYQYSCSQNSSIMTSYVLLDPAVDILKKVTLYLAHNRSEGREVNCKFYSEGKPWKATHSDPRVVTLRATYLHTELSQAFKITKHCTMPYHPLGNGWMMKTNWTPLTILHIYIYTREED